MADVATLNTESWAFMLAEYQRGKLRRTKLVRILRDTAHAPPPPEALAMIANIIEGTGKSLARGGDGMTASRRQAVARMTATIEGWIANPEALRQLLREEGEDGTLLEWIEQAHRRTTYKNRKRVTAREQAKTMVAERLHMSKSKLEHAVPKRRKKLPDSLRKK